MQREIILGKGYGKKGVGWGIYPSFGVKPKLHTLQVQLNGRLKARSGYVQLLLEILREPVADQCLIWNRLHRRHLLNGLNLERIHLNRDILQVSPPFAR